MSSSRIIAGNTASLLVANFVPKALMFVLLVVSARKLGPGEYGIYATAAGVIAVISVLTDFGINQLMIQEIARFPSRVDSIFWGVLKLKVPMFLMIIGLVVAVPYVLGYDASLKTSIAVLGASALMGGLGEHMGAVLKANERMVPIAIAMIAKGLSALLLGYAAIEVGLGVLGLSFSFLIGSFVGTFGLGVGLMRFVPDLWRYPVEDAARLRNLLRRAGPFFVMYLLMAFFQRIDIVVLSKLQPITAVAWYDAAFKIVDATMMIPVAVTGALFPYFSREYVASPEGLVKGANKVLKYLLCIALPIAVAGTFYGKEVIFTLYSGAYLNAAPVLQILSWALVFMFLGSLMGVLGVSADRLWFSVAVNLVHLAIVLGLIFILVPPGGLGLGYVGSAWAVLGAEFLNFLIWFVYLRRRGFALRLMNNLLRLLPPLALMFLVAALLLDAKLLGVILAFCAYSFGVVVLGYFDREDIAALSGFLPNKWVNGRRGD